MHHLRLLERAAVRPAEAVDPEAVAAGAGDFMALPRMIPMSWHGWFSVGIWRSSLGPLDWRSNLDDVEVRHVPLELPT